MMKTKIRHPEKVNKPVNPIKKKPDWIRSKLSNSKEFFLTKTIVNQNNLVTVCQEANCPNDHESLQSDLIFLGGCKSTHVSYLIALIKNDYWRFVTTRKY